MSDKLSLYLKGNWPGLADLLQSEIQYCANIGDSVRLTCLISEYGCCQIQIGNQFESHIVYQFLKDSQTSNTQQLSIKEQAFVYRFLGLYALFDGNMNLAQERYDKAIAAYQYIDEAVEEAIMLLESYRWLYFLVDDQEKKSYIYDRLELVGEPLLSKSMKELQAQLHPFSTENTDDVIVQFRDYINFFSKNEIAPHPMIALYLELFTALQQNETEKAINYIYSLLAKTKQYKHPLFMGWTYFLAGSILEKPQYFKKSAAIFEQLKLVTIETECHRCGLKNDFYMNKKELNIENPKISFTLFKEFTIKMNQTHIKEMKWKRKKAEELLIYLLLQPNFQINKELLLEELFSEDDNKKAANRLYVNLHAINKQFSEITNSNETIISIKNGKVQLNLNIIDEVDIQIYLKLYSVGKQLWFVDREEAVGLLEKARILFDNHFATNIFYTEWLYQFRSHLKEKHVDLLQKLYSFYNDKHLKEELLNDLLECDPFNEEITKEKILFLHAQERFLEAKQFYHKQKAHLKEELGVDFNLDMDVVR